MLRLRNAVWATMESHAASKRPVVSGLLLSCPHLVGAREEVHMQGSGVAVGSCD